MWYHLNFQYNIRGDLVNDKLSESTAKRSVHEETSKKIGAMWFDHNIIFKLINYYVHLKISSYICENNLFN